MACKSNESFSSVFASFRIIEHFKSECKINHAQLSYNLNLFPAIDGPILTSKVSSIDVAGVFQRLIVEIESFWLFSFELLLYNS